MRQRPADRQTDRLTETERVRGCDRKTESDKHIKKEKGRERNIGEK